MSHCFLSLLAALCVMGSVGAWLYSGAAAIQPDDACPGYKHFFLAPQFTSRLSHAKAT